MNIKLVILVGAIMLTVPFLLIDSDADADDEYMARIGDTPYGTLNDALDSSKNGDIVIVIDGCHLDSNAAVPDGVTLLIPYSDGKGEVDEDGFELGPDPQKDGKYRKRADDSYCRNTLTIGSGVTLDVYGTVVIGGIMSEKFTFDYQGHTWGDHGKIALDGNIVMKDGSEMKCYGYIRGNGTLLAENGSVVSEPFIITDYVGGDHMRDMYEEDQSPFNRYTFSNIETDITLSYGSNLNGSVVLYAGGNSMQASVSIIGTSGQSVDPLIELKEGSSATIQYDPKKYVKSNWESNIWSDIGKSTIILNGGAFFNGIEMKYGSRTVDTSAIAFSIPYNYDYILQNGEYLMKTGFRLLPGSSITVSPDSELVVEDELQIYNGLEDVTYKDKYYPGADILSEFGFPTHGSLYVDGKLTIANGGCVLGIIESHGNGKITMDPSVNRYSNVKVTYGIGDNTSRMLSTSAYDGDGQLITLKPGSETVIKTGSTETTGFVYIENGRTVTKEIDQTYIGIIESSSGGSDVIVVDDKSGIDLQLVAVFMCILAAVVVVSLAIVYKIKMK